jgi:hypothetical protein
MAFVQALSSILCLTPSRQWEACRNKEFAMNILIGGGIKDLVTNSRARLSMTIKK